MYIENVTLKSVPADSLILPVEEGTILTQNGTIPADLSQAYGIVPQKITNIPPTKRIYLAVAGTIDLKLNNVSFTEEEMQALGKDFNFVPGDEGGGNPNRVETITGTLASPFGDLGSEFSEALLSNNANALLGVDATALGFGTIVYPLLATGSEQIIAVITNIQDDSCNDSEARWAINHLGDFTLTYAYWVSAEVDYDPPVLVTNLMDYATLLPTTLTIIWHPLPDQS